MCHRHVPSLFFCLLRPIRPNPHLQSTFDDIVKFLDSAEADAQFPRKKFVSSSRRLDKPRNQKSIAKKEGNMRKSGSGNTIIRSVLCVCVLAALLGSHLEAQNLTAARTLVPGRDYVPGQLLVQLKEGFDRERMEQLTFAVTEGRGGIMHSFDRTPGLFLLEIPEREEAALADAYSARDEVEYAQFNYLYHVGTTPNDPYFGLQWSLRWENPHNADIDAEFAWDKVTGSDVMVGVIDTGVSAEEQRVGNLRFHYPNHPDLIPNLWVNPGETYDGTDTDGNGVVDDVYGTGCDPYGWDGKMRGDIKDLLKNSHGTHVAGIIGASGNDGYGVCGVAWRLKMVTLRACPSGACRTDTVINAIDYGVARGARIFNGSFASHPGTFGQEFGDLVFQNKIKQYPDALFIFAAGNWQQDLDLQPMYPCALDEPNVVCVAAIDNPGDLWDDPGVPPGENGAGSNWGVRTVHLAAPGASILSTIRKLHPISDQHWPIDHPEPTVGDIHGHLTGTSMAAPHVTGVAALLKSQEPDRTASQLKEIILLSAQPTTSGSLADKVHAGGTLNARLALGTTGDSFDDAVENSRFFVDTPTRNRWAIPENGPGARCDLKIVTLSGTRDRAVEVRHSRVAGEAGAYWSLAGYKDEVHAGAAQHLVLRIASETGGFSGKKGRIGVGVLQPLSSQQADCGGEYTRMIYSQTSFAGLELNAADPSTGIRNPDYARFFIFFDAPYTEHLFPQLIPVASLDRISIQVYYSHAYCDLRISDTRTGATLFGWQRVYYPGGWSLPTGFRPGFLYYGVEPGEATDQKLSVRAFVSVKVD
jgi:subtilisin family serine protease